MAQKRCFRPFWAIFGPKLRFFNIKTSFFSSKMEITLCGSRFKKVWWPILNGQMWVYKKHIFSKICVPTKKLEGVVTTTPYLMRLWHIYVTLPNWAAPSPGPVVFDLNFWPHHFIEKSGVFLNARRFCYAKITFLSGEITCTGSGLFFKRNFMGLDQF